MGISNKTGNLVLTTGNKSEMTTGYATLYMEHNLSAADIKAKGLPAADVDKVVRLLRINEYKRRQAPVGPRVTPRAYGRDWRYPITSGWRE